MKVMGLIIVKDMAAASESFLAYDAQIVRGILAMPRELRERVADCIIATVKPKGQWSRHRDALAAFHANGWAVAHRFRM